MANIETTSGIVLSSIKYRETSLIIKIFTYHFGLRTYLANGVRTSNKNSKFKPAFFSPLNKLEIQVYHHPNRPINRLAEVRCTAWPSYDSNHASAALSIFLSELLLSVLHESDPLPELFEFLEEIIEQINEPKQIALIPNYVALHLASYLGFAVDKNQLETDTMGVSGPLLPEEVNLLNQLLFETWPTEPSAFDRATRNALLNRLINFFSEHIDNYRKPQSHLIYSQIFN